MHIIQQRFDIPGILHCQHKSGRYHHANPLSSVTSTVKAAKSRTMNGASVVCYNLTLEYHSCSRTARFYFYVEIALNHYCQNKDKCPTI